MSQFSGDSRSLLTNSIFDNSILKITSISPENKNFGTGFVIGRDELATHILTCTQVIKVVGGIEQVRVANQTAVVIAYRENNQFGGLAILRVEQQLGAGILPLGESGVPGSQVIAIGYQANSTEMKVELIKGYLDKSVRQKRKASPNCSYIWKLKFSNEFKLGTGFLGAPVIDTKSYTVVGVISQQEDQCQEIQALAVNELKNVWLDMPVNMLRNKIYDLEKVSNLLKFVVKDNDQLFNYFSDQFPIVFRDKDIPFLVRLHYLINYCNYQNLLNNLLTSLEEASNRNRYYKLVDASTTIRKPNKVKLHKKLLSRFPKYWSYLSFFNLVSRQIKKKEISLCEITFSIDYSKCSCEILHAAIHALAGVLELSKDEIRLLDVRLGSLIMKLEVPSNAIDKLIALFEDDRHTMKQLGILYVTETFDERFILENIQVLLNRSYTTEEITAIYQKYFSSSLQAHPLEVEKSKIIDNLIDSLNQESWISQLLSSISKQKPEAYDKFEPYYKIPRRPSKENKRRATSHLTLCEKIKGGFSGTGVAFFGFILLSILDAFVSDRLHKEVYIFRSIFSTVFSLCLIPLGGVVGRVVAKTIGRRVGDAAGRLAATAFSIGTIGLPLGIMVLLIIIEPPKSILEIIKLLISPFFDPDHPFDSLWTIIGLNKGSHSAYEKAMD